MSSESGDRRSRNVRRSQARRRVPKASPEAYRRVGREVLEQRFDPECWAQALAISEGGHEETVAHYARLRTKALTERLDESSARRREFQERQRACYKSVLDFESASEGSRMELDLRQWKGVADSIFWHLVMVVGMTSCLLAMAALWPTFGLSVGLGSILILAFAVQTFPLLGWLASGRTRQLPYRRVAQMSACVSIFASFALGLYTLTTPEAIVRQEGKEPPRVPMVGADPQAPVEETDAGELVASSDPTPPPID